MKVNFTRICSNCDEVFTGNICPACASEHGLWLSKIIGTMPPAEKKTILERIADAVAAQGDDQLAAGMESLQ
jgi:hypothetical protein